MCLCRTFWWLLPMIILVILSVRTILQDFEQVCLLQPRQGWTFLPVGRRQRLGGSIISWSSWSLDDDHDDLMMIMMTLWWWCCDDGYFLISSWVWPMTMKTFRVVAQSLKQLITTMGIIFTMTWAHFRRNVLIVIMVISTRRCQLLPCPYLLDANVFFKRC